MRRLRFFGAVCGLFLLVTMIGWAVGLRTPVVERSSSRTMPEPGQIVGGEGDRPGTITQLETELGGSDRGSPSPPKPEKIRVSIPPPVPLPTQDPQPQPLPQPQQQPDLQTAIEPETDRPPPTTVEVLAVGVTQQSEQRFYVDPVNGLDDNAGTSEDQAWASLATALGRLQAGQTLCLLSGEYTETMAPGGAHYLVTNGGRADDWVRITAAAGHRPVIVGTSLPAIEVRADFVEISNLTLEGRGYDVGNSWGVGLGARDSHNIVFSGNSVSGFALAGINTIRASDVSIVGNRVFRNAWFSPEQGSGISLWSSKNHEGDRGVNRIIGNLVYENENRVDSGRWPGLQTDGNGIIIDEARLHDYRGSFLIANNLVINNGGRAIHIWKSDNVDVVFNTTYHNAWSERLNGRAELSAGHSKNLRFLNNLVWADHDSGVPAMNVDIDQRTGRPTVGLHSEGNLLVTRRGSAAVGSGDRVTTEHPQLVGPAPTADPENFRPVAGSVVIDRAVTYGPIPDVDFLGRRRSGRADVGAFEFWD